MLPVLLSTVALLLFLIWHNRSKEAGEKMKRLPPGPAPAPVVGNFFQVYVKEPYKCYLEVGKPLFSVVH